MDRLASKAPQRLPTITYGYNLLNEPTLLSNPASGSYPAHSIEYGYDGAGRKRFETNDGLQVSYSYDPAGNRTRTRWPDGYFVTYQYDAANCMKTVWEGDVNNVKLADYECDSLSRRTSVQFANQASNKITYTYEPDSNLDVLTNVLNGTIVTLDYAYNRSGQIREIAASDDFYLALPAAPGSTAYTPNNLNQYSSVSGSSITYDANDNLTSWVAHDGRHTYTYDVENRLRSAAIAGSTTASITYDYDPLGRRVSKTVNGTVTRYLLDGDEEIAELNSAGVVQRRYITGPTIDDRIAKAEGSAITNPTKSYFHVNHQGSVIAVTDAAGTVAQRLSYDEYGGLSSASIVTGEQFRHTGRRFDPETRLYYFRARYYTPELGRFLQTDPVGYEADLNLYSYVYNDALNQTDPNGECPWCIAGAVLSGTLQLAAEVSAAGGFSKLDVAAYKRIGISAATGAVGGGAGALIGKLAVATTRLAASATAGAAISAAQETASATIVEGRLPTASELGDAALAGATVSVAGGSVAEGMRRGGLHSER